MCAILFTLYFCEATKIQVSQTGGYKLFTVRVSANAKVASTGRVLLW